METSLRRRRRILLHFLLGIGLPSVLLGYLAFRGIQNDVALLEQQRLSEHREIAQQILDTVNDTISQVERSFVESIANSPSSRPIVLHSLEFLKSEQRLVEEVFLLESPDQIDLPLAKLVFVPSGSAAPQRTPSSRTALFPGEQFEFQQKRYQEALASYETAFEQASNRQEEGDALSAIARVQKKLSLFPDAIESYTAIAQDYGDVRTGNGIPLGLAARLELGDLFLTTDDSSRAAQAFLRVYEALIRAEWTLEKSQYEFFVEQIENSIDEILSKNEAMESLKSSFSALKEEETRQRELTHRLLAFQENAAPSLLKKVPRNTEGNLDTACRLTLDIGGDAYFVSMPEEAIEDRADAIWGILLDPEQLKTGLLTTAIQQHLPSADLHWMVSGRDGESILASEVTTAGPMTVSTDLIGNFPPWSVELYQPAPHLVKTLLTSRRGVYLYTFILIAGILVFGLTLTIRTVTHELELVRMKSDFVSTVSHEFKSPLTSIRQLAEMLQSGRVPSEERRQSYYDVLVEQSERLSLLIDNILDFARMEEGKKEFEFKPVDMSSLLEELVSTIQQQVRHEGFIVEAEIDSPLPSILVDPAAMTQALTNLIDNAIKYSAESKKVFIRGFTENRYVVIVVQDFGVGVKPEEIEKVFERFYRGGDELTRKVKGSGLGLTLVKQIVEAHRGSVHVDSEPGRGSIFSIKLPLQRTEA